MGHTQGPWMVQLGAYSWRVFSSIDGYRETICGGVSTQEPTKEDNANARLIAAAPDLLDACKAAARIMNDYGNAINWPPDMPMEYAEAINQLRAAIKKAEDV